VEAEGSVARSGNAPDGSHAAWESHELYRRLVELSPDALFVIQDGYHAFANGRGLTLLGARELADLRRQPALSYMHGPGSTMARGRLSRIVDGTALDYVEEQVLTLDGRVVDIESAGMPITYEGSPAALVVVRDITERRRTETARQQAEARWRSAFAHAPIGMAILSPGEAVVAANPALCQMLETSAERLVGSGLEELTVPEDRPRLRTLLNHDLDAPDATTEIRMRGRHGDVWALVSASATTDGREEAHALVQLVDITARKEAEEQLAYLALHDTLTGLPDRALLSDRLQGALSRSRRSGVPVAVIFIDLDRFKQVNDMWGHEQGDHVLCEAAARLSAAVRPSDTVARLGGDEFVVLAEGGDVEGYTQLATRLREALAQPVTVAGRVQPMSASLGLAVCDGTTDASTALREADGAMYDAKQQARGSVCTRTPGTPSREHAAP